MEFINEEKQTELGLTAEQLAAITPLYNDHIANLKGEWDGKANTNAEAILNGAALSVEKTTGVKRTDGEKVADYIERSGSEFLKSQKTELETAKAEYATKLKEFKGDEATKAELEAARQKLDDAQKLLVDYDAIKEKAEKYEPLTQEYSTMKIEVAFGSVKPNFPDTVNPYEGKAKWDEFKAGVLKEWTVEYKDGKAIAKNNENPHKEVALSELLAKDESITTLMQGRQQQGSGTSPKGLEKIEGVPFEVPKGGDVKDLVPLIQAQCAKEGWVKGTPSYSARFKELNDRVMQKTA